MQKDNKKTIALSIIIAAIIIAGAVLYVARPKTTVAPTPSQTSLADKGLSIEGLPVLGNADAPATILEFGDFQCSYCAMFFSQTEPTLQKEFIDTGKANLVFKTLAFIGQESIDAGLAAECSADQGKFWPMHDAIYSAEVAELAKNKSNENTGNLNRDFFASEADKLGMNKADFLSCYDSKKYSSKLDSNMSDADKAMNGRVGTPAIFIIKDGQATQVNQTQQGPFDIAEYERIIGK